MFIISRNGCFSLDCILNSLKLTYLSKRLTSDVVRRDCRSFCTPRSRSFCCRSTAPSSVLHTRLDTQYVAAICNLTLSFIIYCISLFSKLSSPITNSLAVEPLAMLAITHRACGGKGISNTVQSPLFFRKTVEIERFVLQAAILVSNAPSLAWGWVFMWWVYLGGGGRFWRRLENSRLSLPSATNPDVHPFGTFETKLASRNEKRARVQRYTER